MRSAASITAIATISVALGCFAPAEDRPGTHLAGPTAQEFPSDWRFTQEFQKIAIQVRTPYLLAHSVTIWCVSVDDSLVVGARNPETKSWPGWVDRDPEVRLKIGSEVYEARLTPIDDTQTLAKIRDAYRNKYDLGDRTDAEWPETRYWFVRARS